MTEINFPQPNQQPSNAELFRTVPNPSENFGNVPQASAGFGNLPKASEPFHNVPDTASRKQNHTLTVREVTRLFEAAGVARSERSIVNWCQRDTLGASRLDAYYDPNERRYFITPESVEWAIAEEQAKAARVNEGKPVATELTNAAKTNSEPMRKAPEPNVHDPELLKENLDLKITNRAKDMFIEQLQKEREGLLNQVVTSSQRIGELETRLLGLTQRADNQRRDV